MKILIDVMKRLSSYCAVRHRYILACEDCVRKRWWWNSVTFTYAAYAIVVQFSEYIDFPGPLPNISVPKISLLPAAILCLFIALFLLIEGGSRLEKARVESTTKAQEPVIKHSDWVSLANEFDRISAHINARWQDNRWTFEGDNYPVAQCKALLKRAGLMLCQTAQDPISEWLDEVRRRGYFEITTYDGKQDIKHGGSIAQVPLKSRIVCLDLAADSLKN
jgi:hypothetical protein